MKKTYIISCIYKEYNLCNKSGHKTIVHVMRKKKKKKKHQNLTTSLKTLKTLSPYLVYPMLALPLTKRLLSSTKLLPLFITSDKGWITERHSSHHQSRSKKHHHHYHLHHPKKTQLAWVKVRLQNHRGEIGGEWCDWFWCSSNTSHWKDGQDDYQN